jgi:hypothetical protein
MNQNELWALEWNQEQACFHITTLQESINKNQEAFLKNQNYGWVILANVGTQDAAHSLSRQFEMLECQGARALYQK